MNNTLSNPEERIFRAIPDEHWNLDGTLKSSAFKQSQAGVSFDREGARALDECIQSLLAQLRGDAASVTIAVIANRDMSCIEDPQPDNRWHCLLFGSREDGRLTDGQAKHLAKNAIRHERKGFTFA